jgi:hypothetical protein
MIPIANITESKAPAALRALNWMYQGLHYQFMVEETAVSNIVLIGVNHAAADVRENMNQFVSGLVYAWNHPLGEPHDS